MPSYPVYTSSNETMLIVMTTDSSVTGPGFYLTWEEGIVDNLSQVLQFSLQAARRTGIGYYRP